MNKKIILAILVGLYSLGSNAQTDELSVSVLLTEIEKNNIDLKTYTNLIESKRLAFESLNNLPDPQAGFYYMPFGNHNTEKYTELQVTQTVEFPTVYRIRGKIIDKESEKLKLDYGLKRQEILFKAKGYLISLIYLSNKKQIITGRLEQAQKLSSQIKILYEKEKIGILDFNKSKIALIQEQLKINQVENEIKENLLFLKTLNGGLAIINIPKSFTDSFNVPTLDSIISDKELNDPAFLLLKKNEEIAQSQIKLNKSQGLPNVTAGFNYQGVAGSNYVGVFTGVSIPIWSNRHKVNEAKVNYTYQQSSTLMVTNTQQTIIAKQLSEFNNLLNSYHEYSTALSGINDQTLLLKAYELGKLSFIEYYAELQFYQKAEDTQIEIEYQLHQLRNEIFKYQL